MNKTTERALIERLLKHMPSETAIYEVLGAAVIDKAITFEEAFDLAHYEHVTMEDAGRQK